MMAAFDDVYLIRLDVDEWGWEQVAPGFYVEAVPVFFRLDADGHPTGDQITGGWDEDTYANIASVMGPWFHQP